MLAYRKWVLSLGIAAVTPGIALAGPFPFSKSDQAVPQSAAPNNQKLAEEAASNLRAAQFSGFDIELEVQSGVCLLKGKIASQAQKDQATQVISRVPGIRSVNNQLVVLNGKPAATQQSPVQQAVARDVTSNPIQQAGFFSRSSRHSRFSRLRRALLRQFKAPVFEATISIFDTKAESQLCWAKLSRLRTLLG